jgi:dTDP-4-amino-4,6-dideoxygalactose transaminase
VLRSDWLTTGPKVEEFETAFAAATEAGYAVCFSSGTGALHGAVAVLGLKSGEEAITTPMTFCASANCLLYCPVQPVFADVDPDTLLIDPAEIERRITPRTRDFSRGGLCRPTSLSGPNQRARQEARAGCD